MNNLLDSSNKDNFLFIASVIAAICERENKPITVRLEEVKKFYDGEIEKLQYDLVLYEDKSKSTITFSLKENKNEN